MKIQYFGDNKDLFKYDLVLQIIHDGLVGHFTFIPMLTKPDNTKQGGDRERKNARAGTENDELLRLLNGCEKRGKDIKALENLLEKQGVKTTIYKEGKYFSRDREQREEYFDQIRDNLLCKSLILVDPDVGLEVRRPTEKHILYSEVQDLHGRMDKSSILMLFQYFPRESHQQYLNRRCEELKDKIIDDWPIYIADNKIVFFFLTKDKSLKNRLGRTIAAYKNTYNRLRIGNVKGG